MSRVIEWSNNVDLTKALMMVFESGEDDDGQIVFYSNCRHFSKEMLNDNGGLRGIAFGVEEIPEED
tara:strand:+ start:1751 stop:1948 length:198 start_codon:yes stop_codon:yes gene_type:complete